MACTELDPGKKGGKSYDMTLLVGEDRGASDEYMRR